MSHSVLTLPHVPTPSDGLPTATYSTQLAVEENLAALLADHLAKYTDPTLAQSTHLSFLTKLLMGPLPSGYTGLDASKPWILYWALHSLALFGGELDKEARGRVVGTLRACQNEGGGFGGGPGQFSHLAPSYAAVSALAGGGEEGWKLVDREGMYRFLMSLKQEDGSWIMHVGGEVDVRGTYCALTVATLLNILTPELARNTSAFVASCQTYEGGLASASHPFAPEQRRTENPPLGEAHGGYAFCALASYSMLRPFDADDSTLSSSSTAPSSLPLSSTVSPTKGTKKQLNLSSLLRWATSVQAMPIEGGGFKGRTNKLVDGCYGWWGGGMFGVLGGLLSEESIARGKSGEVGDLYDRVALQEYILLLAQAPNGGLRDKPGKGPDAYHTCYNLSGLSSAQHFLLPVSPSSLASLAEKFVDPFGQAQLVEVGGETESGEVKMILGKGESEEMAMRRMKELYVRAVGWEKRADSLLIGGADNEVMPTHPIFNITMQNALPMLAYFYRQPAPTPTVA